jgi:hypothetical protein
MRSERVTNYRFSVHLGNAIDIAPFVVEASWPTECRLESSNVAGYVTDFDRRPDCQVIATVGELALAHCRI